MEGERKLSQTMRIDLIPDVPAEPAKGKSVVIKPVTRRFHKVDVATSAPRDRSGYQELLQSIYDGVIITTLEGAIVDVNVRAIEFLQYERAGFSDLSIFEVISGADQTLLGRLWQNLQDEKHALIQAYCMRKDGTFFPAEIAVNMLHLGEVRLCFFVRDITVRRQQEEMLRTEHMAIQNAGTGIAIANLDAQIEYANTATAGMWGYSSADEVMGVDVRDMIGDREIAAQMVESVLKQRHPWVGEFRARRNGGEVFDVQISAACNCNSDGETVGMVLSFVNVSDRKRAETAERDAERNRVMLESLGAACHHLGQPATVLMANIGIMAARLKDSDEAVKDLVKSSMEAAERLGAVLHRLNTVNEYRTVRYLEGHGTEDAPDNRILDINM